MKLSRLFVLGACSVTFLASCGCSNDSDQKILDQINTVLKNNASDINTCYDAVTVVESDGIEMNEHKFASQNEEFVYDSKAKQFVIMNGDTIVKQSSGYQANKNKLDYFKSVFTYNPNSKYSQYLDKRASVPEQLLITTGFDIGAHVDIPNIAYTNLSGNAHDVIIRTYSDYFSVLAPLDTVHHYEIANNVIVTDIKTLDNHANTAYINAKKGFVNFASESQTLFFEVEGGCENDVSVELDNEAYFIAAINITKTISGKDIPNIVSDSVSNKTELDTALLTQNNFIRLTNDITYPSDSKIDLSEDVCIDLAGYKLTFEGGDSSGLAINVANGHSLYLLDSQGVLDDNSGILLKDSYIEINSGGDGSSMSQLMVNGGKITQEISNGNPIAAVRCVGSDATSGVYNSQFIMYGGKIETKLTAPVEVPQNVCVTSFGPGAYVDIVYGTLISNTCCIAYHPSVPTVSQPDGSKLFIEGGRFTSTAGAENACIDYGWGADITITGGTFNGDTCISLTNGSLTIVGGTFNSSAQFRGSDAMFGADGSVIDIYKATGTQDLTIDITDATLYSKFAYVLSAQGSAKADVTFHQGAYSYYLDKFMIHDDAEVVPVIEHEENFTQHSL